MERGNEGGAVPNTPPTKMGNKRQVCREQQDNCEGATAADHPAAEADPFASVRGKAGQSCKRCPVLCTVAYENPLALWAIWTRVAKHWSGTASEVNDEER